MSERQINCVLNFLAISTMTSSKCLEEVLPKGLSIINTLESYLPVSPFSSSSFTLAWELLLRRAFDYGNMFLFL